MYSTSKDPWKIENPVYLREKGGRYYFAINPKEISSEEISSETHPTNYISYFKDE